MRRWAVCCEASACRHKRRAPATAERPGLAGEKSLKRAPRTPKKLQRTHKSKRIRLFFQDEARIGQKGRVFRDQRVFEVLCDRILPGIAQRARNQQRDAQCWSAGCASGREPYTLRLLWDLKTGAAARLSIVATDIDDAVLARARKGCYPVASLRELPPDLVARGFEEGDHLFHIHERHRRGITFMHHDLRSDAIPGFFDLILCRNLAFTYFAPRLQCQVLERLAERLRPNGWLVIGAHERLPDTASPRLAPLAAAPHIFERV